MVRSGSAATPTDLLGDCAHRIPPLTDRRRRRPGALGAGRPLLFGHRGAEPVDVAALEDLLARVARLADDLPEVAELELNPVVVAEQGAHVLGAVVRIAPTPGGGRADAGRRELTASS